MSEVNQEVLDMAAKITKQNDERKILIRQKHSHALADTLQFDNNKYSVLITCGTCGDQNRRVFTSDLHQVKHCVSCSDKAKKARRDEQKAKERQALVNLTVVQPMVLAAPLQPVPTEQEMEQMAQVMEQPVVVAPKKRGRPKGSKNKAKAA